MSDTELYHYIVEEKRRQHVYLEPEEITGMDENEIDDLVCYKLHEEYWESYDCSIEHFGLETF